MKKIGIDARLFSQTGVGVYIENLLYYFEKYIPNDWEVKIYALKNDLQRVNFKRGNFLVKEANYYWHKMGEQIGFLNLLMKDDLDLMHFTYLSYPIFYKRAFISTVHDLTHLIFKSGKASTKNALIYNIKHQALKMVLSSQVTNSKAIITPTKTVKKQLIRQFSQLPEEKIHPIYEGVNEQIKTAIPNTTLKRKFTKDFFIYIGNFYPHKNIERLIRAFAKVKGEVNLVLAGPDDFFSNSMIPLIKQLNQDERIVLYKNPTREDLVFFYKNAKALINPSLAEGFGLTNIEAMFFGCPVIGSDIEVFHETMGRDCIYFNPYDSDDISEKINEFIKSGFKSNFRKLQQKYTFEKMTKETIEVYNKVLSS